MKRLKQIEEFAARMAQEFKPERIILFGSHAYGKPTRDSDVDIMVIMPLEGNPIDMSVEMRTRLRPPFPLDLLVRTPAKISERLAMGDDFVADVLTNGRVIYEAHHI